MSAIVTILREGTSESIQVYVDPKEKIEDIINRCKEYWSLEGSLDDYVLIRNNVELSREKTVISSDIKEGDVIRFCERGETPTSEKREKTAEKKDPVSSAKQWLQENLGLTQDNLEMIERSDGDNSTKLGFKNLDRDEHYTVIIQSGDVKTYIPALMEDLDEVR